MQVIAIVRLGRGEVAFFDEVSKVYLTLSRPVAQVYDTMNTANLRKAIYYKRLELVNGTLNPVDTKTEEPVIEEQVVNKEIKAVEVEVPVETVVEVQEVEETVDAGEEPIVEVEAAVKETKEKVEEEVEVKTTKAKPKAKAKAKK